MKSIRILALVGFLFTSNLLFASTPAEGWYAGLGGGLSLMNNPKFSSATPPFLLIVPAWTFFHFTNGSLRHGVGGNVFGQVGARICNFRFEGELLYNLAPISRFSVGGRTIVRHVTPTIPVRLKGSTNLAAGLFNAFYDFYDEENDPTWVPYLGLGLGYAHINNSVTFSARETHPAFHPIIIHPSLHPINFSFTTNRTRSAPIGQIILGISYYESDTLAFGLDYRYLTTKSIRTLGSRISVSTINFNFNYWFHDET